MPRAKVIEADLRDAILAHADPTADLWHANLQGTRIESAKLKAAHLDELIL
jgi:uncharacterized protein YjbI with pentapeptide repeats